MYTSKQNIVVIPSTRHVYLSNGRVEIALWPLVWQIRHTQGFFLHQYLPTDWSLRGFWPLKGWLGGVRTGTEIQKWENATAYGWSAKMFSSLTCYRWQQTLHCIAFTLIPPLRACRYLFNCTIVVVWDNIYNFLSEYRERLNYTTTFLNYLRLQL